MMPETPRAGCGPPLPQNEAELLAGLWQEAPFARLPPNAPPELRPFVHDIENPCRVYAIHRASRRHGFQFLVERFIVQLRRGCGQPDCKTPTCFSCRKRLAGKAPLRKYNATSARTLAVYMASQDNPEDHACPNLQPPGEPPAALSTLIFAPRQPTMPRPDAVRVKAKIPTRQKDNIAVTRSTREQPAVERSRTPRPVPERYPTPAASTDIRTPTSPDHFVSRNVDIIESPISKDHRSFAANLFGTVAFKMLDWLNPRGLEALSKQASVVDTTGPKDTPPDAKAGTEDSSICSSHGGSREVLHREPSEPEETRSSTQPQPTRHIDSAAPHESLPGAGAKSRHISTSKSRTIPTKPKRTKSLESYPNQIVPDDAKPSVLSPCFHTIHPDKHNRSKASRSIPGRGIPDVPAKPAFFDNVNSPTAQKPRFTYSSSDTNDKPVAEKQNLNNARQAALDPKPLSEPWSAENLPEAWLKNALPQALTKLDVPLIEFICDVFLEDETFESAFGGLARAPDVCSRPSKLSGRLVRQRLKSKSSSRATWKLFNEQSIFSVLSDPHSTLSSFSSEDGLYDSHTLWYCLHRLSSVEPSLVAHSLWLAAEAFFVPERSMQLRNSARHRPTTHGLQNIALSDQEAAQLMSICLHALVATTPIIPEPRTLYEMSRTRSHGLTLATGSPVARQASSRCLSYDDSFSNELNTRLARRVFCGITTRRCFAELSASPSRTDILGLLLAQLDVLRDNSSPMLDFPLPDRELHETRMPTVLLDWARTILLKDWDGRPAFSMDGPFGGAFSFIETMYESRNLLLLADIQFRVDYFSDRLDSVDMPIEWLSFQSTKWQRHILDYPYIFSPESRVSFFRSINFARMSRTFEESSSLKTRMSAIVDPGSLITNPHHKKVLQDLLQTASSKYLILEIGRGNVARDAFDQLWRREKRELLRPLKVHLGEDGGEEGFDSGGVQQEFFRLAIAECLDPQFGAFTVDERTHMVWFCPGSLVEDWKFELVGLLMSLALYNGLTLPVTFPKALYRKLLGHPVNDLHHIADGWPELASGLTTLIDWDEKDGLVEDVFARTYEFSISTFGTNVSREMTGEGVAWPKAAANVADGPPPNSGNPDNAPLVTDRNRDAYVNDYIRYLTDVSIRPHFLAFERGFHACLDAKSLTLLSPPILQALVEGGQEIDIAELRRYTRYVGWDVAHHTIIDFWSIVKRYDDRMKRKLLEFVTSSDRVPVGGMKNLQFVIQKNGEEEGDGGHLPTAYTCYGTLLLPEYRDKEVLRERLGMALENAQGFGFA